MRGQREQIQPAEMKTIVSILSAAENDKADQTPVATAQSEGIHIAGDRYVVARIDGRSIYARKVGGKPPLLLENEDGRELVG